MITKIRLLVLIISVYCVKGEDDFVSTGFGEITEVKIQKSKQNPSENKSGIETPTTQISTDQENFESTPGPINTGSISDVLDPYESTTFLPVETSINLGDDLEATTSSTESPATTWIPSESDTNTVVATDSKHVAARRLNLPTENFDVNTIETVTSIQEVLTEMKTNQMIEQKIVDAMNEFSSNCNIYKPIMLSIKNFALPTELRIDIGQNKIARFYNFRINESSEENEEWKTHNTMIGCDSSENVQIKVSVPSKIMIAADVEILDSSQNGIDKGTILLTLRGISVFKNLLRGRKTYKTSPVPEFSFEKSEISLNIGMAHQLPIYLRLDAFFEKLKPLQQFYSHQLQWKLEKEGISLPSSCSNVVYAARNLATNTSLNNLYVISDVKFETWKGLTLSAGPILIDGLLNFNTTEFVVTKPVASNLNANYGPENKVIKRIKTENLKGKFEWQYHGQTNVLPFTIDYIDFESIFTKKAVVGNEINAATNPNMNSNINVRVGEVEIQPSQEKYCENENHFANFILSGYIQAMVTDLLKESIHNKFISELSLQKCDSF